MSTLIVTGAGSGIGCETALYFARRGHRVYAAVRDVARAEALRDAVASEALEVEILELDVRSTEQVARARAQLEARGEGIDVLVNNAGIRLGGSVEETDEERVLALLQTNYLGAVRMCRAFLPALRARGRSAPSGAQANTGCIVNVSSITGHFPGACYAHYAASKAALEAFSQGLAQELAPFGVRVCVVVPGQVRTGIFAQLPPPDPNSPYAQPLRRLARRREVQLERASTAAEVASAIDIAISCDPPRFRHVVGAAARQMWDARMQEDDQAWVDCAALTDDEAYYTRMAELCGVDLHRS